jgi:recombination protein RecT
MATNPDLFNCSKNSFIAAVMTAAQLGLEPNTPLGQLYFIPFKDSKLGKILCQIVIGYKGLVALAYGSGKVSSVEAHTVYENDIFEMKFGLHPVFSHEIPLRGERGKAIGYWAMFRTTDGGAVYDYMSVEEARVHGERFSKSFEKGPWKTDFDEMAKKTVLRKILKVAPLSPEARLAIEQDGAIRETEHTENVLTEPIIESELVEEDIK